jgi:hypothetical protein
MRDLVYQHGCTVLAAIHGRFADLKPASNESTINFSKLRTVEKDVRFPVDSMKDEPQTPPLALRWNGEYIAVLEVIVRKKLLRYLRLLVPVKRVRDGAGL